jgi:hypothetical protein
MNEEMEILKLKHMAEFISCPVVLKHKFQDSVCGENEWNELRPSYGLL